MIDFLHGPEVGPRSYISSKVQVSAERCRSLNHPLQGTALAHAPTFPGVPASLLERVP